MFIILVIKLGSSLFPNFNLVWKTATLCALVIPKCSDWLFYALIISTVFSSIMLFLFLHLVVRLMNWVIFHFRFILNLTATLTLAPIFDLKAYIWHTEPFRKKLDGSWVSSLFTNDNWGTCQYIPHNFFWMRKGLGIVKAHVSLGTLQGAAEPAALAASISLVSILQAGDWATCSTSDGH